MGKFVFIDVISFQSIFLHGKLLPNIFFCHVLPHFILIILRQPSFGFYVGVLLSSVVVVVVVVEDYRPMGFTPLQKLFIGPNSIRFSTHGITSNISSILSLIFYSGDFFSLFFLLGLFYFLAFREFYCVTAATDPAGN